MTRDDIISMAREAGARPSKHPEKWDVWEFQDPAIERFAALVAAAERDRTSRLVQDMQAELQTLRDRLARQKPVLWVLKDNPGITTMREPSVKALWEPLGNIV